VPIAKKRLEPLGVQVIEPESDQELPFEDARFDLVLNRHESFTASEIHRVLKPGGLCITQQVGGRDNIRLNELLGAGTVLAYSDWTLEAAAGELESAGLRVVLQLEEYPDTVLSDIGAVVYYLKAIPWQIPDFRVEAYRPQLRTLHNLIQEKGELNIRSHRFYIEAQREPGEVA
jgi:SAM-dependent methyltransferase